MLSGQGVDSCQGARPRIVNLLGNCSCIALTTYIPVGVWKNWIWPDFPIIFVKYVQYSFLWSVNATSMWHFSPQMIEKSDFIMPFGCKPALPRYGSYSRTGSKAPDSAV